MTRKNTEERREQIIHAFFQTVAEHGYAKATINRVAAQAELTPGLVHYHFKNKQEILLGLLDRMVETQIALMRSNIERYDTPTAQLHALIDSFLATGSDADPAAVASWVMIAAEAIRQQEVREQFERAVINLIEVFDGVLVAGFEQGVFVNNTLGPQACSAAMLALVQGYFMLAATTRESIPAGSAAPAARAMMGGLLGIEQD